MPSEKVSSEKVPSEKLPEDDASADDLSRGVAAPTSPAPTKRRFLAEHIEMAHGAGGLATRYLIEGLVLPALENPWLEPLGDAALIDLVGEAGGRQLAFTSDSFVVRPLTFPGGSIGELAVNGTVNDLAVSGARPEALLLNLVLEAGLPVEILRAEIEAVATAARRAGVVVAGGDTKVVESGKADGMYVTTAGIGRVDSRARLDPLRARPGDRVLLSGPIGDHGITILLARGDVELEADLRSDTRSVFPLVESLIRVAGEDVRWMRDPTRGGLATALSEFAGVAGLGVSLSEEVVPIHEPVRGACELLGLDPLHIANEGQFVAIVAAASADDALAAIRQVPGGEGACFIGDVVETPAKTVICRSSYGGSRIVDMLVGDPLPRIC